MVETEVNTIVYFTTLPLTTLEDIYLDNIMTEFQVQAFLKLDKDPTQKHLINKIRKEGDFPKP